MSSSDNQLEGLRRVCAVLRRRFPAVSNWIDHGEVAEASVYGVMVLRYRRTKRAATDRLYIPAPHLYSTGSARLAVVSSTAQCRPDY